MIRVLRLWWLTKRQEYAQRRRKHWSRVEQRVSDIIAKLRGRR